MFVFFFFFFDVCVSGVVGEEGRLAWNLFCSPGWPGNLLHSSCFGLPSSEITGVRYCA